MLHGTWLGHPLHPVLTDVTIGAWLSSYVLDLLSLASHSRGVERAADTLLDVGNASAAATALAGVTDFSTIPHRAVATGATHGLLNGLGLVIHLLSSWRRKSGNRDLGIGLSAVGSGILFVTAYLGGEMAYKYKVGVNKIPQLPQREKWYLTIHDQELPERTPRRVAVNGSSVMLYRDQGQIYAIGCVCGHEGGPLNEGEFEEHCVTCPWHQSVYDLRDGSVVHGPATYAQPDYEVQVVQGRIEVRLIS